MFEESYPARPGGVDDRRKKRRIGPESAEFCAAPDKVRLA
jgi:hypothetical protein